MVNTTRKIVGSKSYSSNASSILGVVLIWESRFQKTLGNLKVLAYSDNWIIWTISSVESFTSNFKPLFSSKRIVASTTSKIVICFEKI